MPKFFKLNKLQRIFVIGLATGLAFFLAVNVASLIRSKVKGQRSNASLGVTFSDKYARELGLDWQESFLAVLDDLKVRNLRIPVYWDVVEAERGRRDWSRYDWMLEEAEKRGAEVVLAVGRKVPRWPECHEPDWVKGQRSKVKGTEDELLMKFLEAEIEHFKTFAAIKTWQVENEPLFHFGRCPPADRALLEKEIALVRSLDSRPIMVTDSGELSTWIGTGTLGDILGISMYRLVWNKYLGELYWPVSPLYYTERINLVSPVVKQVVVSELQAEPWFRKPPVETPLEEQLEQMNPRRLRENVEFARETGAPSILLWGAEWWYWLKLQGRPEMWEAARSLF
jgi:hypothetical protein